MKSICVLVSLAVCVSGMDNGLVRTPPMGWLAWERFRCEVDCDKYPDDCINEKLFMSMADRLVDDGWRDLGYDLVHIDDCWAAKSRDKDGNLVPDPKRFPNGIKYIADYVHSRGLKLGIYGDYGTLTCGGYPGSMGFEEKDANTFASWGVDMLKFDGCYSNSTQQAIGYPLMSKKLNETGRPIIFSCSWPAYRGGLPPKVNYTLLGEICNVWRNYGDIQDSWDDVVDIVNWWGKNQDVLIPAAGPGKWNDPDMLIGGDFSLSLNQIKAQFGLWAIMAAPMFMSNDLRRLTPEQTHILQNRAVIAVSQDKLGIQGKRIKNDNNMQLWTRTLSNNNLAVAVLSTRTDGVPRQYKFKLSDLEIQNPNDEYILMDVFETIPFQQYHYMDDINIDVNPNGIRMFIAVIPAASSKNVQSDFQML